MITNLYQARWIIVAAFALLGMAIGLYSWRSRKNAHTNMSIKKSSGTRQIRISDQAPASAPLPTLHEMGTEERRTQSDITNVSAESDFEQSFKFWQGQIEHVLRLFRQQHQLRKLGTDTYQGFGFRRFFDRIVSSFPEVSWDVGANHVAWLARNDPNDADRYYKILLLALVDNADSRAALLSLLKDDGADCWGRHCAAIALGRLGAEFLPFLIEKFTSLDSEIVRRGLIQGIGLTQTREAFEFCWATFCARETSGLDPLATDYGLGEFCNPELLPRYIEIFNNVTSGISKSDPRPDEVWWIVGGMTDIMKDAMPWVVDMLNRLDPEAEYWKRYALWRALHYATSSGFGDPRLTFDDWEKGYQSYFGEDGRIRGTFLQNMMHYDPKRATPHVVRAISAANVNAVIDPDWVTSTAVPLLSPAMTGIEKLQKAYMATFDSQLLVLRQELWAECVAWILRVPDMGFKVEGVRQMAEVVASETDVREFERLADNVKRQISVLATNSPALSVYLPTTLEHIDKWKIEARARGRASE